MPNTINMNAPALTNKQAIDLAYERLTSVVCFCLDLNVEPDASDKESIRKAHEALGLVVSNAARESL